MEGQLRIIFPAVLLVTFVLACGNKESSRTPGRISDQALVIDVRTDAEFKSGHIKRAINIPFDEIGSRINSVTTEKNREIVLYCRSGRRSGIALKTLKEIGYTRLQNAGGYEQFRKRLGE